MNWTSSIASRWISCLLLGIALLGLPHVAAATQAYNNPGPFVEPWMFPTYLPGLPSPSKVPTKEYSHDHDATTVGASTVPVPSDAQQVIMWDGFGGTQDGKDFTSTRPSYAADDDIDALANWFDALLDQTLDDTAHLIFSIDDEITVYSEVVPSTGKYVPSAGPVSLSNGKSLGGAGELSYELAGTYSPSSSQGLWASQAMINSSPHPTDIDALEMWGTIDTNGDTIKEEIFNPDTKRNKYSLSNDYASFNTALPSDAVSVWNYNGTPFLAHSAIVDAVVALLGVPTDESLDHVPLIDLDALMVFSQFRIPINVFDSSEDETQHDLVLFSIRQIADAQDESGYYATGSEVFWLDASGAPGFLHHGGHDWDKTYALENLAFDTEFGSGVVDLDALEAVSVEVIPEPATAALLVIGALVLLLNRRRN